MIYIVDEEVRFCRPYMTRFMLEGFEVKQLHDADTAFDVLLTAMDIEFVIIDVMLATKSKNESRFDFADTKGMLGTGLSLLSYLSDERPEVFPSRSLLFSMATDSELVSAITSTSKEYNVPYLRKNKTGTDDLVERVRAIINKNYNIG